MSGWQRPFGWFWGARAVSQFGDEISQLALPWVVAGTTGSAFLVGALQTLMLLPAVLMGLHIGVFADRWPRRRLMQLSDLSRFVLVGSIAGIALTLDGRTSTTHILIVAFLVGIASATFEAAAQPLLADVVPSTRLVWANSRLSVTEGVAIIAGPPVAGVLIASIGPAETLGVDAATFLVSACCLAMLPALREGIDRSSPEMARTAIREGISEIAGRPALRALTQIQALANFASGVLIGLVVVFFQQTLGFGSVTTGLVFAANGAGVLLASAATSRIVGHLGLGRTYLIGVGVAAVGCVISSAAQGSAAEPMAGAGWTLIGLGTMVSFIVASSYRQHAVARRLLGRVTATSRMVFNAATAAGALAGGIVGEVWSIRGALIAAAVLYSATAAYALSTPLNAPDPPELTSAMS